jgi:hypothetical protein
VKSKAIAMGIGAIVAPMSVLAADRPTGFFVTSRVMGNGSKLS